MRKAVALACALLLAPLALAAESLSLSEPVVMRGAAVAETPNGLVGSTATFTITVGTNGSGHVFLDTFPLTQIDMQGSARLASRVAAQVSGKSLDDYDFFFVIRSGSTQIGGPSAGATLTVGAIAALNGWKVRSDVLMTGTIQLDGSVGPVGGIPEKAQAAANVGMKTFLFPAGEETQPLSASPGTTVNMQDYCATTLRMTCLPVSDVFAAVENMTDHSFNRAPVTGDVTGDSFRAKLGPLSEQLLEQARALLREAETEFAGVTALQAQAAIATQLVEARGTLQRAESAYSNGTYYTAASLSFQASIAAHDARDRSRVAKTTDLTSTLASLLVASRDAVARARAEVDAAPLRTTSDFESAGAAQVRIIEAEQRLAQASQSFQNGSDISGGIYEAAYAVERAQTATWWLQLGSDAQGASKVDVAGLDETARDAIATSTEEIAYVEAVFARASTGAALNVARQKLSAAESALDRGYYAAAILNAFEAQVRASNTLILASFGTIPPERIEAARVEAARAIQSARARGAEPLLAASEYEFGGTLEDPVEQAAFYGLARLTANLAGISDAFAASESQATTRFQGIPASFAPDARLVVVILVVGVAVGSFFGILIGRARKRDAQEVRARIEPAPRASAGHASVMDPSEWRE